MTQHRGGSGNSAEDKERASDAGHKGGKSGSKAKNDHEKDSDTGKKGGKSGSRSS